MRIANLDGRLSVLTHAGSVDVESASGGRFGPDPQAVYGRWAEFRAWASTADLSTAASFSPARLASPAPAPAQVLGIGLNYRIHAEETGFSVPAQPSVFTLSLAARSTARPSSGAAPGT